PDDGGDLAGAGVEVVFFALRFQPGQLHPDGLVRRLVPQAHHQALRLLGRCPHSHGALFNVNAFNRYRHPRHVLDALAELVLEPLQPISVYQGAVRARARVGDPPNVELGRDRTASRSWPVRHVDLPGGAREGPSVAPAQARLRVAAGPDLEPAESRL